MSRSVSSPDSVPEPASRSLPHPVGEVLPEAPPYRWVIMIVCTLIIAGTAVVWHGFSVFLAELTHSFGWPRGDVALGFFIFVVCSGLMGPNAGQLIARFGIRRVVLGGAVILAVGLAATSQMTALWQFYVFFGVVSAVGFAASGWVPVVTVIQTWFRRRIGAAMGIVSAGAGLGIMALVPAIQMSILAFGWRTTYLIMAGVALAVLGPLGLFLQPGPLGRARDTTRPAAGAAASPPDDPLVVDREWVSRRWSLRLALQTRRYWFFLAGAFLTSFASQQVMAHQVAYLRDTGFPALAAASVVGIVGVASVPAKVTWGVLSDRIGRELTYTIGVTLVISALVIIWLVPFVPLGWLPYLYAVLIGAGYAVSATMPPTMASDMFRGAAYGAIFGGISMASNVGSGVGSWLAGFIFDQTGSYYLAFAIAIAGVITGAVCIWLAGARHVRRVPGRAPIRVQSSRFKVQNSKA